MRSESSLRFRQTQNFWEFGQCMDILCLIELFLLRFSSEFWVSTLYAVHQAYSPSTISLTNNSNNNSILHLRTATFATNDSYCSPRPPSRTPPLWCLSPDYHPAHLR